MVLPRPQPVRKVGRRHRYHRSKRASESPIERGREEEEEEGAKDAKRLASTHNYPSRCHRRHAGRREEGRPRRAAAVGISILDSGAKLGKREGGEKEEG